MKTKLFLCMALTAAAGLACAQPFPSKTVKITAPFASGTGPEVFVRMLAEKLSKAWGRPAIVEARPGASGFIAIEALKNSTPDGHELLLASNGHTSINPALYKKLPYDPEKDLVPVAMVYYVPFFVSVSSAGPYQSVSALIAAAKAKAGQVSYASPYIGSPAHLGTAEFELLTDTTMLHVPFKDQNQAFVSIANGEVGWMFTTLASALPMIKAGRIKILAIAAKRRSKSQPDVPTLAEVGGPGALVVDSWVALFAPRGTPPEIVHKINAEVNTQLSAPEVLERMKLFGWESAPATPEQIAEMIRSDTKKYVELVRRTGASAE